MWNRSVQRNPRGIESLRSEKREIRIAPFREISERSEKSGIAPFRDPAPFREIQRNEVRKGPREKKADMERNEFSN